MLSKTKKWLNSPKIKPYQMILAIVGLMVVVFMETSLYQEFPDYAKLVIYGTLILVSILAGVSIVDLKQIAIKLREIMEDKKMSLWEKVKAFMTVGMEALSKAGESWELFHEEQFDEVKQEKIEDLQAEIKRLQTEINKTS